jgi:hypothetical protein
MDNGMNKNKTEKIEEMLLCFISVMGLLFMVLHWK